MALHKVTCSEALGRAEAALRSALGNPNLASEDEDVQSAAEDEVLFAEDAVEAARNREGCI